MSDQKAKVGENKRDKYTWLAEERRNFIRISY